MSAATGQAEPTAFDAVKQKLRELRLEKVALQKSSSAARRARDHVEEAANHHLKANLFELADHIANIYAQELQTDFDDDLLVTVRDKLELRLSSTAAFLARNIEPVFWDRDEANEQSQMNRNEIFDNQKRVNELKNARNENPFQPGTNSGKESNKKQQAAHVKETNTQKTLSDNGPYTPMETESYPNHGRVFITKKEKKHKNKKKRVATKRLAEEHLEAAAVAAIDGLQDN